MQNNMEYGIWISKQIHSNRRTFCVQTLYSRLVLLCISIRWYSFSASVGNAACVDNVRTELVGEFSNKHSEVRLLYRGHIIRVSGRQ